MLTVRNGNNFDFTGRFDGTDYFFPVGMMTAIPDDAAKHIFGVGLTDKMDVLVRHGWIRHSGELDQGMAILNGFSFNVANELNPGDIIDPVNGQGSAPLQTATGDATVSSDPVVSPVSTSGGSILDRLSGV